jgi:nitric oxide reductase activation protein
MLNNAPDAQRRVLIIVCDGMPSGGGYYGNLGVEHVTSVVNKARKGGVEVFAVFVGRIGQAQEQMNKMYGRENHDWIHVPQPDDLPTAVERIAKRVLFWDGGAA